MWIRKALAGALALGSLALAPLPASAAVDVYLDFAPPAPRYEVLPAVRPGFVWQPGYWQWRDGRHVWVRGHWVRDRPGWYWQPSRWVERDGRWYFERGRWDRERYAFHGRWDDRRPFVERRGPEGDRDRDGVPNAYDRDRDGDGVPNRFDAYPNNPYRR